MRPPRGEQVQVIVCEDVRVDASTRLNLLGVYGPSIEVETFPTILPTLCGVVLVLNPAEWFSHVRSEFVDPNGVQLARGELNIAKPADLSLFQSQHVLKMYPVPLSQSGIYSFRWWFTDDNSVGLVRD